MHQYRRVPQRLLRDHTVVLEPAGHMLAVRGVTKPNPRSSFHSVSLPCCRIWPFSISVWPWPRRY